MQTYQGKTIVSKSTNVRYYSEHRINLEYRPLAAPKYERHIWFRAEDGSLVGYMVSKKVYDSFDVPDTTRPENPWFRQEWERALKRSQRRQGVPSYNW